MSDDAIKIAQLKERYEALLHAVQSGVKWEHEAQRESGIPEDTRASGPKHLRTGVNSALIQNSSLVMLLMRKGLISEREYWETQVEFFEDEVERYNQRATQTLGTQVRFH